LHNPLTASQSRFGERSALSAALAGSAEKPNSESFREQALNCVKKTGQAVQHRMSNSKKICVNL